MTSLDPHCERNLGFNGIRTRDLRVTGTLLYSLSYEATHWQPGYFGEFYLSHEGRDDRIYEIMKHLTLKYLQHPGRVL